MPKGLWNKLRFSNQSLIPMRFGSSSALLFSFLLVPAGSMFARVFTDDQGRSAEAELAGVIDKDVLLRRSGVEMRLPLAKLSKPDQRYVKEWQSNPPVTPKLSVRLWKREGFSSAGTIAKEAGGPPGVPNIPGIHEVEKRDTFHYFEVDITNPSATQANLLTLSYQMYVIPPSGSVIVEVGKEVVPAVNPGKRVAVSTKAISTSRTKTTTLKLTSGLFGGVSTGQQSKRDRERFGGAWVRVYSHDGKMVGEARELDRDLQQLKPAWVAPTHADTPAVEGGLDGFDKFVQQVREKLGAIEEFLKKLPPPPVPGGGENKSDKPKPPPLPPAPR